MRACLACVLRSVRRVWRCVAGGGWRGLALGHLVFQTCVVGRFRLGRAGRPAVPPRFPRQSPRTLLGLRLGSDLDTGLGRRALSFARLSVDRGGRAYPSPSTSLIAKFYRADQPMLRMAAMTKMIAMVTTSGDRSRPDTGGTQRRTGASMGSVARKTRRCHSLVGCGLNHERAARTKTRMRRA